MDSKRPISRQEPALPQKEEEEEFITIQNEPILPTITSNQTPDNEHGTLVRKLLETKQSFDAKEPIPIPINTEAFEQQRQKDREQAEKQVLFHY